MKTSEYIYWKPPFDEYNKVQSAVVPFCDKDMNIIVAIPTASGKTVIAECAFGYHVSMKEHCIYTCPFRALCNEKRDAWAGTSLASNGISAWSGDNSERTESGLVISTLESLDFAVKSCRHDDYIKSLRCLVLDEAHIIGDGRRGSVAENILMKITEINPMCRVILLSATMGNSVELAKWVKFLNGKETKCVNSSWRPVDIDYRLYPVPDKEKIDKAVEIASENRYVKTILFVQSLKTGTETVKRLRAAGIRSVFHNASLKPHIRNKIETEFNDPYSGLDILVSTSTLGAGVNIG